MTDEAVLVRLDTFFFYINELKKKNPKTRMYV